MTSTEHMVVRDDSWEATRKRLAMKWFFFRVEWAMLANEQAFWGGVSKYCTTDDAPVTFVCLKL